ncbi:hypothetical protein TWF128_004915 [Orbilia oligospora]|nr:hypothetical protein TWF128_004915 [Orbilia oligospora]
MFHMRFLCKRLFYKHRVEPQTQPTPRVSFACSLHLSTLGATHGFDYFEGSWFALWTKESHNETIFLKLLWSYD